MSFCIRAYFCGTSYLRVVLVRCEGEDLHVVVTTDKYMGCTARQIQKYIQLFAPFSVATCGRCEIICSYRYSLYISFNIYMYVYIYIYTYSYIYTYIHICIRVCITSSLLSSIFCGTIYFTLVGYRYLGRKRTVTLVDPWRLSWYPRRSWR